MNQKNKHLDEARLLVSVIAARRNRLKPEDIRFLENWESYLRNPESSPISKWRIHNLRNVIVSLSEREPGPKDGIDVPGYIDIEKMKPRRIEENEERDS
jgi:hypothetical protein